MTQQQNEGDLAVDAVIPVHAERLEGLEATLSACLKQNYPFSRIIIVDDGSAEVVCLPDWAQSLPQICLFRLPQNSGISGARNVGIARSKAPLVACINAQVLPDPDWLAACVSYLSSHPRAGACYGRLVPQKPDRLLTRWRMRFLETRFGEESGPTAFAPGHAVLFRKEALDAVGGYDVRYRRHHEDSDICRRMGTCGWETHYVAQARCISVQEDTLKELATKELRESYWYSPAESSLVRLYLHLSKWTFIRAGRNVAKGRFYFIPLDLAIWASALWTATIRTLGFSEVFQGRTGTTSHALATPSTALLEKILAERPRLHRGETETGAVISAQDTFLRGTSFDCITKNLPGDYGLDPVVARFLYESISEDGRTLETGAGISTLIFALRRSTHIAVTPNASEVATIQAYARTNHISLDRVEFIVEPSDLYLPRCVTQDLDLVLIDGKHAFPWPIIDWFYTADKLKVGGILILDDLQLSSVSILRDFILEDPRWKFIKSFGRRTLAARKIARSVHDVAWHMQPYISRRYGRRARVLNALGIQKR